MFRTFRLLTKWMHVRKLVNRIFEMKLSELDFVAKIVIDILNIMYHLVLANDWPQVFDDSLARSDWNWSHQYGIDELCEVSILKFYQINI